MKILVIDNYDSFVYNLVHILKGLAVETVDVIKNDKININEVAGYDKILLSPGPGIPKDAGLMPAIIQKYASSKSILGVCLGHQAIAECFGGTLINLKEPLHGIASDITIMKQDYLFANLPTHFKIGHYHSWVVNTQLTAELEVLAKDDKDNIMALKHIDFDVRGVQFHPESILTEYGKNIIENWINK